MIGRLSSLRLQLLLAMILAALAGLGGAYLVIARIEHAEERSIVEQRAREVARAISAEAAEGASEARFRRDQRVLGNDELFVVRRGRTIFAGPRGQGDLTATAISRFPDGFVRIVAHSNEQGRPTLEVMLVVAVALLLLTAVAVLTAGLLSREVRDPIGRAIDAADRVAAGDLSARVGPVALEELGRLAHAFDGMAARLESADENQRRFLADIAHEIATPLNAIVGYATALADGTATTPQAREEAASVIAGESARLRALLDDLRHLTALDITEAGGEEPVELAAFSDELAARFLPQARTAGIGLHAHAEPLTVTTNRRLLETIIVNFLTNAIRYTPTGGSVEIQAQRRRNEFVIAVRDTGIGIAAEHRDRIFDRLYRVDEARARATGGAGLGLAITQRAAGALGGRIELDSEPGVGSEFRLVLPGSERNV